MLENNSLRRFQTLCKIEICQGNSCSNRVDERGAAGVVDITEWEEPRQRIVSGGDEAVDTGRGVVLSSHGGDWSGRLPTARARCAFHR